MKLDQFTFLCVAAAVDGQIGSEEEALLLRLAEDLGLGLDAARTCMAQAATHAKLSIDPTWTEEERWTLLEQLASVVRADGVVMPVEATFVDRVSAALGCDPSKTRALLQAPAQEPAKAELKRSDPASPRLALLATTPPWIWCWVASSLLLVGGFVLVLGPNVLQSQLRALGLLAAVLVGGAAYRERRPLGRPALWVLAILTAVAWMSRHSMGNVRFGVACMLLGVVAFGLGAALRESLPPAGDRPRHQFTFQRLLLIGGLIWVACALGTVFGALNLMGTEVTNQGASSSPSDIGHYTGALSYWVKSGLVVLGTLALGAISLVASAIGGAFFLSYLGSIFAGRKATNAGEGKSD